MTVDKLYLWDSTTTVKEVNSKMLQHTGTSVIAIRSTDSSNDPRDLWNQDYITNNKSLRIIGMGI